jgi:DUF1680 family protein
MTQQTSYPNLGETALHLKMDRAERFTIALRVPAWAGSQSHVHVNGKPIWSAQQSDVLRPGTWAEIDREWKDGDRIEFAIDMPLRLIPIDAEHKNTVALLRGPVALFAIEPGTKVMTQKQMLQAQKVAATSSDWQVQTDQGVVVMKSYPQITNEQYRLYQET